MSALGSWLDFQEVFMRLFGEKHSTKKIDGAGAEDRAKFLATQPWKALEFSIPDHILSVPMKISDEEQTMLAFIGSLTEGSGKLVELGALFGGPAACLAYGASVNRATFDLHVYDFFSPPPQHGKKYLVDQGSEDPDGDTLKLVSGFLAEFGDNVSLHKGGILKTTLSGAIEVLHVDASKSDKQCDFIARTFMPNLIAGQSTVIIQDFLMQGHPWAIHMMYALRDYFTYAASTEVNSALFIYNGGLTSKTEAIDRITTASDEDYINAVLWAAEFLPAESHRTSMARHISLIQDNPGGRHVSQFPNRDLSPERLAKIAQDYGL
ncbi:MAG: hypothetical protein VX874_10780 [Pseudomonadota bacterium]|nr:hypothetical protein [Pseudomonadota bacterium]